MDSSEESYRQPKHVVTENISILYITQARNPSAARLHFPKHGSNIPPTGHAQRLPANIAKQRAGSGQNSHGSLRRRAGPAQRDIGMLAAAAGILLRLRDAEGDLLAIWRRDEGALLLSRREAGHDMAEGDGDGADAELGAPFLRDGLGETRDAGLGEGVVGLARVAVQAGGAADVDDDAGLAVLDAEVGGRGADELEGGRVVQGDNGVPLLVGGLNAARTYASARTLQPAQYIRELESKGANHTL